MGFYTSIHYYRPTPPPMIDGLMLAEFIRRFGQAKVTTERWLRASVKFGRPIDADEESAYGIEWNGDIGRPREIDWDIQEAEVGSLAELSKLLGNHSEPIYRAHLSLGGTTDEIRNALERVGSPQNEQGFAPFDWSLGLGPVYVYDPARYPTYFLGWIALSLSGDGYLYPWKPRDIRIRAEACAGIRRATELCRDMWPVHPAAPPARIHEARTQMGPLWPYDTIDPPWNWYWGTSESG